MLTAKGGRFAIAAASAACKLKNLVTMSNLK
jgi:hypothetical protein